MACKIHIMFAIATTLSICIVIFQLCVTLYDRPSVSDDDIPIVLWWTPFGTNNHVKACGRTKCYFTHDRSFQSNVRLKNILFYGSDLRVRDLPSWRDSAVSWGLLHEESPRNNPILVHEEALNLFNYSSTFSRFSNIPLTLLDLPSLDELIEETYYVHTKEKTALMHTQNLAPVLYIQSDCDTASNRDRYVLELMKHIRIDSYGECLNNAQLDDRLKDNYINILNNCEFLSFVAKYKFTIAFENAICEDYVTEKLWRPLIVGSVPIYYGSPSFKDWLPNTKSAISILDFAKPAQLAQFLHKLVKNDSAYEEYLSHKLGNREYRVTNDKLLHSLERRPTGVPNEFGNYLEAFECFICERIQNNRKLQIDTVTKQQYDCPLPRDPITGEIDEHNWWIDQWNIEKCGAKLLAHYVINNISFSINGFNKQKMYMYDNDEC
ncbi:PREDICTED: alpha-(1,3)-fucosyltransferase 10 [Dinoponera quadriceps]|uniref:Fucosyltransferase n=1 Tax=Dinoponera quadriceps TaxID=609295 RepID=A0A6P3WXG7_DINQU|nr:PREDICTED: alpha-(1,3)-fucosyltransferase 10 [Dinoponera quadriceps]XP_014470327.1 PREDICTED: alpha-(1,3)-fucosyltransferase 10 [Dinoponera quadriceps]XP_014470328.1 PREDICTED: alpha-(1,3)-fucosyltransferase 10 [Dinoponera quadriceps]XP_014470329.1 PREDICTED: alpha-(1,3)-fucosyltransferase 10 [Dinoponera quadriceps]XP_014470330.1 PREDICTED: alpha-(1,3)-fucosyltransferase 10 [Dinoponera quadriceps]